jgi:tetratricopeptide (TPR) repeat protein
MAKHTKGKKSQPLRRPSDGGGIGKGLNKKDPGVAQVDAMLPTILNHLNQGRMREGMRLIESGLRIAPQHPELPFLAGQIIMLHSPSGDGAKAREYLQRAVDLEPRNAKFRITLANALNADGQYELALVEARRALRLDSALVPAHTTIGIAQAHLNRHREAAEAFENAVRIQPENPDLWLNLALCRLELRDVEQVLRAVDQVERLVADPPARLLDHLGKIFDGLGQYARAVQYYQQSIDKAPQNGHVWFALADILTKSGDLDAAGSALDEAETLGHPQDAILFARARIFGQKGLVTEASAHLAKAFTLCRDNPDQLNAIAAEYIVLGDFEAQERCLERVLEIEPGNPRAFGLLAQVPGRNVDAGQLRRLEQIADATDVDVSARRQIAFTLGDNFRQAKDYDRSFRYYRLGNRLKGYRFDELAYRDWQARIESAFSKDLFQRRAQSGSPSRLPMLIVGMPRSGTTLVEQIVSAHPLIYGAGEFGPVARIAQVEGLEISGFEAPIDRLTDISNDVLARYSANYLQEIESVARGTNSVHVTNKLPHNFQQLGLFALLFPNAPIIHIKRDPRDNLLSVFFQDFRGSHQYGYDLKALGRYYRLYEKLMIHWAEVLPNPLLQLQYEDLVADVPASTKAIVEFLDVDMDPAMLRYWEQDRKVKTASLWQVRQPVYTSSIGRWKPYEKHLKPLFKALDI